MNREIHVRFCEGLGCNSLGLLTYVRAWHLELGFETGDAPTALSGAGIVSTAGDYGHDYGRWRGQDSGTGTQSPGISIAQCGREEANRSGVPDERGVGIDHRAAPRHEREPVVSLAQAACTRAARPDAAAERAAACGASQGVGGCGEAIGNGAGAGD